MTRIIHTGDTHLGYQQYHRPERRADFLDSFRQVVEDAIAEDVDAVVHAGDLFHDRRPTLSDVLGALSVLRNLSDADIPFLAIVGNHESKRDAQWLDLFETMGLATRLDAGPVLVDDVAVYGLDFVPRSQRDGLDYGFESNDADHAVLVTHGLFEPFAHGDWDARDILTSSPVAFDALLLGDDHEPKTTRVEKPYETWLSYCGSTERASTAERAERGYNIVVFEETIDIRRRGLDTRDFVFVDVELGHGEGTTRVTERLSEHDLTDSVVVVSIDGEGDPVTPATIEDYAAERGALTTRITDHREQPDEPDVEVNFADPDDAVRDRLDELELSPAARELDETIRASKVADSNLADTVQQRVAERIEGDLSGFGTTSERTEESGSAVPGSDEPGAVDDSTADETASEPTDGDDGQITMEDYL
jgi:DNA repair exonuclease SbcCD nuclease subunit